MRGNSHVRFGEEPRGNDPPRAPRRAAYSTPACTPSSPPCPGARSQSHMKPASEAMAVRSAVL